MVTKTTPEAVRVQQQTEVVIETHKAEVPAEIKEKAQVVVDRVVRQFEQQTERYAMRVAAEAEKRRMSPELATPMLPSGYQYWNCLTLGPYQFLGPPPWSPNKIVAAGNPFLMLGLIWANPTLTPDFGLPGTIVLGGHEYRARFESINLSTVQDGPDYEILNTFPSPAPVVTPLLWLVPDAPDPGPNPALYEVNLTIDVTLGGQPFAAFSTWHYDPDYEPPFLLYTPWERPPYPAHWQFERPARFMIYQP